MTLAVTLPDFLDADTLRTASIVAVVVVVLLALLVIRFVRKTVMRLVFLGVLAAAGIVLWTQWDDLRDCQDTCDCTFLGLSVDVPDPACDLIGS
jgi:hypothetical protein